MRGLDIGVRLMASVCQVRTVSPGTVCRDGKASVSEQPVVSVADEMTAWLPRVTDKTGLSDVMLFLSLVKLLNLVMTILLPEITPIYIIFYIFRM
jgi:hypothetical protein